ncbi:MAG: hypothetical protein K0R24_1094 [Gammaproteobacteria bacterium]|jgi:uncharacterized protein YjbJ (UPF0337 family)|nr:hypothetical protein [Gammaproteobacteria bacterium]
MNTEIEKVIEENWDKLEGKINDRWDKLSGDDIAKIKGSYGALVDKIKAVYYQTEAKATEQIKTFLKDEHMDLKE